MIKGLKLTGIAAVLVSTRRLAAVTAVAHWPALLASAGREARSGVSGLSAQASDGCVVVVVAVGGFG